MKNKTLYDFEGFRIDMDQGCLWRDEELVALTPKAFETLVVLVKNSGRVISKNSILDEVWANTFVEESTLAQNISTLRKTLAKYEDDKEFIVTIPRRGYRFVADVTEVSAGEEVLVVEKHSVTQIVSEQEQIHSSDELAVQTAGSNRTSYGNTVMVGIPIAVISLVIAALFVVFNIGRSNSLYQTRFQSFEMSTLFSSPNVRQVSASPDGKYMAVIESKSDGDSILLSQLDEGNTVNILPNSNLSIAGAAFSHDSKHIYYSAYKRSDKSPRFGGLYRIPILGGASAEIIKDVDSPPAVSKDDKKIAFVRNDLNKSTSSLITANIDGSEERILATHKQPDYFLTTGSSWSPDGKFIAASMVDRDDPAFVRVMLIDTETGEQKALTEKSWLWIGQTVWLGDGSGIAFVAYGTNSPNITDEVWFVSYPEGKLRRVISGVKGVNGISLSDKGDSIVVTKSNRITGSFVSPIENLSDSVEIAKNSDEKSLLKLSSSWIGNDRIAYARTRNGNVDIWKMGADGSNHSQLTSDKAADFSPVVDEQGKEVFFLSNRSGRTQVWKMGMNGENQTKLTEKRFISSISLPANDDSVYFAAKHEKKPLGILWRMDRDGSNQRALTEQRVHRPKVSPDGKYVVCYYPDGDSDNGSSLTRFRTVVLSAEDGSVTKRFAWLRNRSLSAFEWKHDSSGFFYIKKSDGRPTLWFQSLDGDKPSKVHSWDDKYVFQLASSKDGSRLFFKKGEEVTSIVQFKDAQIKAR